MKCDICKQEKVWAWFKVLNGTVCTDCSGHIAQIAKEKGIIGVREKLDAENSGNT